MDRIVPIKISGIEKSGSILNNISALKIYSLIISRNMIEIPIGKLASFAL